MTRSFGERAGHLQRQNATGFRHLDARALPLGAVPKPSHVGRDGRCRGCDPSGIRQDVEGVGWIRRQCRPAPCLAPAYHAQCHGGRCPKAEPASHGATRRLLEERTAEVLDSPDFEGDAILARLHAAISTLPPKQRWVFQARYFDDRPYVDLASETGTSEGALKASYHHAKKKIEAILQKEAESWFH